MSGLFVNVVCFKLCCWSAQMPLGHLSQALPLPDARGSRAAPAMLQDALAAALSRAARATTGGASSASSSAGKP